MNKQKRAVLFIISQLILYGMSIYCLHGKFSSEEDVVVKELIDIQCWLCSIIWLMAIQFTIWNHSENHE